MDKIDRLLAQVNPVEFMMEMPIAALEKLVDRMEKAQSEARIEKIFKKIFSIRQKDKMKKRRKRAKSCPP